MKTTLTGTAKELIISTDGPVVIIGESINPTRRKKLVSTLQAGNFEYVQELAESQIRAGADALDVNVGFPGVDDIKLLPETVKAIQSAFDIPLCLDSPNPKGGGGGRVATVAFLSGRERKTATRTLPRSPFDGFVGGRCWD
ncbi:MAG: hypothetical protein R6W81_13775 [Bacteroidales bacterium]